MIVFTVIGVLVYWWAMFWVGYGLGMYLDARRGINQLVAAVDRDVQEIERLVYTITAMTRKAA